MISWIFWGGYFLYEWLANAAMDSMYGNDFIQACLYTSITFVAAWITLHWIILRYFLPVRRKGAWWILAASVVSFTLARRIFSYYIVYKHFRPEYYHVVPYFYFPKILGEGVWMYLVIGGSIMLYFMKAWYEQQRLAESLKREKAVAQLELLKSQVHPHFIFNTLNNIYSLSIHRDPRTPDLIHRLSSLLSYMLYESKDTVIPVAKEIEYISNYVELQKIRYSDRLDVSVNIFGSLESFYVTPLLLLPLMENCFKHGVSNEVENSWIRMDVERTGEWLAVKLENSRAAANGHAVAENGHAVAENGLAVAENGGIGLTNVRHRLEILYPGEHEFKTMSEEQSFLAVLRIKNQRI